jgi:tyrosyl-tRNA synthetase
VDAGLASSKSEARNFVSSGAISVNGEKITNENTTLKHGVNVMKRGKNSFAIIEF